MARVAIEFDAQQTFIAAMQTVSRRRQLKHLTCLQHEASAEATTAALTAEVAQAGLSKSDVVVVVCRSDVELRVLDVPPAPASELPAMVKFVAKNEFASLNDNWVLDFVRLSGDANEAGKVLAAGLSPERKSRIEETIESAGMRLKQIVFRPLAAANYLATQLTGDDLRVLIELRDANANISLFDGRAMFATRTFRLVGGDLNKTFEREIKRTIGVANVSADKLSEILLLGEMDVVTPLGDSLSQLLSKPHRVIDLAKDRAFGQKLRGVDHSHRYVPLLGTLAETRADATPGMDFLNPRKVEIKKTDLSKWYLSAGVAAVGLLLLFGYGYWRLSQQANKIAIKEDELKQITDLNEGLADRPAVADTMKQVGKIDDWVRSGINWQDALLAYSENALTPDDAIVDSLSVNQRGSTQLTVKARIKDYQTAGDLVKELQRQPEFVVTQKGSKPIADPEFARESNLEIKFERDQQQLLKKIDSRAATFLSEQQAARLAKPNTNTPSN